MGDLADIKRHIRALCRPGGLAALAAAQHGVVARWQLLEAGLSRGVVRRRLERGHLHRLHHGVYAVGHRRLTTKGRWMAAVLAGGPEAVLSHWSAIALWELRPSRSGPLDVTVPGRSHRAARAGIRFHNVRHLDPQDRAVIDGIPVTSLHRALLDYAEVTRRPQQLRLALEAADRRELLDARKLEAVCGRACGRRGVKPLKAATAEPTGPRAVDPIRA